MAEGCWEAVLTAVPLLMSAFTSARQLIQSTLRVWLGDKGGGVLWRAFPRVAIYLANTAHAPKATILHQARFVTARLSKQRWWNQADRARFILRSGNQKLIEKISPFCVWVLSVDLLLYSAVVSHSDVSTRKGHCGIWKQLCSYFSLYLRSALRMPNCLLGCFHKSCRGATNPVFIHCLLALT